MMEKNRLNYVLDYVFEHYLDCSLDSDHREEVEEAYEEVKGLINSESTLIEIEVDSYENTCGACPTVYDFKDTEGTNYYFRLRWGYASLSNEDTGKDLICDQMEGFDGVCNWSDFVNWARKHGVLINY